jgi:elongation factor Ts
MSTTVNITAAEINNLRQQTGAGMMDCRKALVESNGDLDAAVDYLRKKGQKVAAQRGDREAKEGVVLAKTNSDNNIGYVLCLSCETDFVSKNADFVAFASSILEVAISNKVTSVETLLELQVEGVAIKDRINEQVAKIGEKIEVSKFEVVEAPFVASYIHGANRMGVLVGFSHSIDDAGKDVAMQVAAMNPFAVDADAISAEAVAREKNVITEQVQADPKMVGKPAEMIEKIALGKLNAFFKENTLLAQLFVKDASLTVGDFVKSKNSEAKVLSFKRIALG